MRFFFRCVECVLADFDSCVPFHGVLVCVFFPICFCKTAVFTIESKKLIFRYVYLGGGRSSWGGGRECAACKFFFRDSCRNHKKGMHHEEVCVGKKNQNYLAPRGVLYIAVRRIALTIWREPCVGLCCMLHVCRYI